MFSKSCQCVSPGTNANPDYKFPLGLQNRRAKRDDYKPSAVRVTQRYVP
ncbi:hypothetical protein [Piscirickettsia salmonis]|nr:hypothetical protein [Piscirickettsia salmonis]